MPDEDLVLRDAADRDSGGLIELIGSVFAEYPGCVLDLEDDMPDLLAPATAFAAKAGRLWVVEVDGRIAAGIACAPMAKRPGIMELSRLYVGAAARRRGIGARLVRLVEAEATARGCGGVELWTDTRFTDAHRLYERLGYSRRPGTRALGDLSNSVEYHYAKPLAAGAATSRPSRSACPAGPG